MTLDEAKRLAYELDRREHTARILVETNPQIAFKTDRKPNEIGKTVSEGVSKAEDNFAMDTAGIPKQGFQGA